MESRRACLNLPSNVSRFGFVIPLKSPGSTSVDDYEVVEGLLKTTVQSLLRQTARGVCVVVVCHRIPNWETGFGNRVRFLKIETAPAGLQDLPAWNDMAFKIMIGMLYMDRVFGPELLMHIDGDDFAHVDIAQKLLSDSREAGDSDGYLIERGVEVLLEHQGDDRFEVRFAVEVSEFDKGCGSCRVFRAIRILQRIRLTYPGFVAAFDRWTIETDATTTAIPSSLLEAVVDEVKPDFVDWGTLVHAIGRHVRQDEFFDFRRIDWMAAAKGCGHGNHSGPTEGSIHWQRVVRVLDTTRMATDFGLDRSLIPSRGQLSHIRYRLALWQSKKNYRRLARVIKRIKWGTRATA